MLKKYRWFRVTSGEKRNGFSVDGDLIVLGKMKCGEILSCSHYFATAKAVTDFFFPRWHLPWLLPCGWGLCSVSSSHQCLAQGWLQPWPSPEWLGREVELSRHIAVWRKDLIRLFPLSQPPFTLISRRKKFKRNISFEKSPAKITVCWKNIG